MRQSFICKNSKCKKISKVHGIHQYDGIEFVICEHCGVKNKLIALPRKEGAPIEFDVSGLIE